MTTSKAYERGDVVYVPFLFVDKSAAKNRPAVVISSAAYHESRNEVIIAGITSNLARTSFVGQSMIHHWRDCGLSKPSVVSGIIQTLRPSFIGRRVGALSIDDLDSLGEALRDSLGLR